MTETLSFNSSNTKRDLLRVLLVDGFQSVKMAVDGDESEGLPDPVVVFGRSTGGVLLDIRPEWPLKLDLDGDPRGVRISLSFGSVCDCFIPWTAVKMIAVGIGGVSWEHETPLKPAPAPTGPGLRIVK